MLSVGKNNKKLKLKCPEMPILTRLRKTVMGTSESEFMLHARHVTW